MSYVGLSPAEERRMLETIGVQRFEQLLEAVPAEVRRERPGIESHRAFSEARARVRAQRPELFGVATYNETASD